MITPQPCPICKMSCEADVKKAHPTAGSMICAFRWTIWAEFSILIGEGDTEFEAWHSAAQRPEVQAIREAEKVRPNKKCCCTQFYAGGEMQISRSGCPIHDENTPAPVAEEPQKFAQIACMEGCGKMLTVPVPFLGDVMCAECCSAGIAASYEPKPAPPAPERGEPKGIPKTEMFCEKCDEVLECAGDRWFHQTGTFAGHAAVPVERKSRFWIMHDLGFNACREMAANIASKRNRISISVDENEHGRKIAKAIRNLKPEASK